MSTTSPACLGRLGPTSGGGSARRPEVLPSPLIVAAIRAGVPPGPWSTVALGAEARAVAGAVPARSARFQCTWQPRCVQRGETATSVPSSRRWPATFSPRVLHDVALAGREVVDRPRSGLGDAVAGEVAPRRCAFSFTDRVRRTRARSAGSGRTGRRTRVRAARTRSASSSPPPCRWSCPTWRSRSPSAAARCAA